MTLYGDILSLAKEKMEANDQKILIVDDTGSYTYEKFVRRAISVAVFLSVKGVHKGSKIGILQADYYEFFATLFGIWLAGCIAVPFNYSLKEDQVSLLIKKADVSTLISDGKRKTEELEVQSIDIHSIQGNSEETGLLKPLSFDDFGLIVFTSGTTGLPKGVLQTLGSQIENARLTSQRLSVENVDRILINTPPYFTSGISHFLTFFLHDASFVGKKSFYFGKDILDDLESFECNCFGGAPTHVIRVANAKAEKKPSIKFWMSSGDFLPYDAIEKFKASFPEVKLYNVYGLTEVSGRFCILPDEKLCEKKGSVGYPLEGMSINIVEEESGMPASSPYIEGEVYVKGPLLFDSYYNDMERTNQALTEYGYRTGDYGYLDADGYLFLKGRKDDIFKRGAEKISSNLIKSKLFEMGLFEDVAVIAIEDFLMGKSPVAFVVKKTEVDLSRRELLNLMKEQLPPSHVPVKVVELEKIPRTGSGKALIHELLEKMKK